MPVMAAMGAALMEASVQKPWRMLAGRIFRRSGGRGAGMKI